MWNPCWRPLINFILCDALYVESKQSSSDVSISDNCLFLLCVCANGIPDEGWFCNGLVTIGVTFWGWLVTIAFFYICAEMGRDFWHMTEIVWNENRNPCWMVFGNYVRDEKNFPPDFEGLDNYWLVTVPACTETQTDGPMACGCAPLCGGTARRMSCKSWNLLCVPGSL